MLDIAEQRFAQLKNTATTENGEWACSEIRLALDDAITPLRIALENLEDA